MTSFSLIIFQTFSPQLQPIKLEFGTPKIDNSFWEFKYQGLNVTVYFSCMMENQLFQDGVMVKLEHFYHSLGNYCTSSTMLIIMDAQLYQQLLMEPESFQVELKDKLEFGKYQRKLKLWKHRWKNTEAEYGQSKLVRTVLKLFQLVEMDHASFGILNLIQEFYACSSRLHLNKLLWTIKNIKF